MATNQYSDSEWQALMSDLPELEPDAVVDWDFSAATDIPDMSNIDPNLSRLDQSPFNTDEWLKPYDSPTQGDRQTLSQNEIADQAEPTADNPSHRGPRLMESIVQPSYSTSDLTAMVRNFCSACVLALQNAFNDTDSGTFRLDAQTR